MRLRQVKIYLIKRWGKIFIHVGIYIDDSIIYHYATMRNDILTGRHIVQQSTIKEFAQNRKIEYCYLQNIEEKILIQRIENFKLERKPYNLFTNNCITFVLYCLLGRYITTAEMLSFAIHHKVLLFSALSPF